MHRWDPSAALRQQAAGGHTGGTLPRCRGALTPPASRLSASSAPHPHALITICSMLVALQCVQGPCGAPAGRPTPPAAPRQQLGSGRWRRRRTAAWRSGGDSRRAEGNEGGSGASQGRRTLALLIACSRHHLRRSSGAGQQQLAVGVPPPQPPPPPPAGPTPASAAALSGLSALVLAGAAVTTLAGSFIVFVLYMRPAIKAAEKAALAAERAALEMEEAAQVRQLPLRGSFGRAPLLAPPASPAPRCSCVLVDTAPSRCGATGDGGCMGAVS